MPLKYAISAADVSSVASDLATKGVPEFKFENDLNGSGGFLVEIPSDTPRRALVLFYVGQLVGESE